MVIRTTDSLDDALADASDNRLLRGPTNQSIKLGADGDARPRPELDSVLAHPIEGRSAALAGISGRAVNDFGVNADLYGFVDIASCQLDGSSGGPLQVHAGFVRSDHRSGNALHGVLVPASVGEKQCFHLLGWELHAGLHQRDLPA